MHPYLFEIGDFPIRSFGVMVLLGVLAAAWWLGRALPAIGVRGEDPVGDLCIRALVAGFLGARLLYIAIHPAAMTDLIAPIALWRGGLVSYGGFVGGALGAWWFARRRRVPMPRLCDALGPALALGQTFGRIGCLLVGDDHGAIWKPGPGQTAADAPWWTITFPPGVEGSLIPPDHAGVPLYPSQILLSLMNLLLFLITAWMFRRRRFDGQVAATTIVLYSIGRFVLERTRGDDAARGIYEWLGWQLSTAQWISLVMFVFGVAFYLRARARGRRAAPAAAVAP